MTIYLIRHGEQQSQTLTDTDPVPDDDDDGLTEHGRAQAQALARLFRLLKDPDHVELLSSPLRRARETAAIIGACLGQEAAFDTRLAEQDLAWVPGRSSSQQRALAYRLLRQPEQMVEGAESLTQHRRRVEDWFAEMAAAVRTDPLRHRLVVSHGGTMAHILACCMGIPLQTMQNYWAGCHCGHLHVIEPFFPEPGWLVWRMAGFDCAPDPTRLRVA